MKSKKNICLSQAHTLISVIFAMNSFTPFCLTVE